jgi:hypothetical protein
MLIFFIKNLFQHVLKSLKLEKSSGTDVGVLFNEVVIG